MGCGTSTKSDAEGASPLPPAQSSASLDKIFKELQKALELKDRQWMGSTYKNCFDAKEAVDWLVSEHRGNICPSREKAVEICRELQSQALIVHVWSSNMKFRDTTMYFRFTGEAGEGEGMQQAADAYDVVVIGGGVAGISAAAFAANLGVKVVCIEAKRLGGDCTWSGCVPSKALIKVSHLAHEAREGTKFGLKDVGSRADMKAVKDQIHKTIHTVAKLDEESLAGTGAPLRYGTAKFIDKNTMELLTPEGKSEKIKSKGFVLCVGAEPAPPPIQGLDGVPYLTYETVFDLDVLPKRLCVIGAGVIGCEMAQAFARLGSEVTLVGSKILPKEPAQVDQLLAEQFQDDGIKLLRGRATSASKTGNGDELRVTVGNIPVLCDVLLVCSGRRPHTLHMNLEAAGVQVDEQSRLIKVDASLKTTTPHIYAAGDCCTLQQFTHYAGIMGFWAVRNLLLPGSGTPTQVVPRVTFTSPEVASVGMTEEEAKIALKDKVQVVRMSNSHNERAICEMDFRGFTEVYLDANGQIVGATLMNNRAGEVLTELLVAMENKIPFQNLAWSSVIHPYPTYSFSTMILASEAAMEKLTGSRTGRMAKWYVASGSSGPAGEKFAEGELNTLFQQMQKTLQTKSRSWMGSTYPDCLDAKEMIDWMVKPDGGKLSSRAQAVQAGRELQVQGLITHVWGSQALKFSDTTMFFRCSKKKGEEEQQAADTYDVVVIGGGVAGISATAFAAAMGAKVVCIEAKRLGGDCTWSGCVPSKALIKMSHILQGAKDARKFGIECSNPKADLKIVKEHVWKAIHSVSKLDEESLEGTGAPLRYGMAKFVDKHTIDLTTPSGEVQKIKSKGFVLCVGAEPAPPPIKGLSSVPYLTYETIFDLDVLPNRLCVVGAGVIGCEMAQAFARLGAEVTLVGSKLLPKEPAQVDKLLSEQFQDDGIKILRGRATEVEKFGEGNKEIKLSVGSDSVICDVLLVCSGRRPHTMHMNLGAAGVEVDTKTRLITVNKNLKTTTDHIYAAGDCCTLQQFTHYAGIMGFWAIRNLLLPGSGVPTHIIPRVTFTAPEVASVGMTEAEAREQVGDKLQVARMANSHNERALCEMDERGFTEVFLDSKGQILGATIMSNRAGEVLTELLVAMENKIPLQNLSWTYTIHPYPTYSFSLMMLASEVSLEKFHGSTSGKLAKWFAAR